MPLFYPLFYMVQLRNYQIELIDGIRASMHNHRSIVAQAPTGAGKSKIFIAIAKMAAQSGTTTLIVTEAKKIFRQIAKEYPSSEIAAHTRINYIRPGSTFIAMAQTLARRNHLIEQFKSIGSKLLIINDEAHIGTSTKLLQQFTDAYMVGFTATPAWKWAKHLSELYTDIVVGPQVSWLVENNFLCPYNHFARVAADIDSLKIKSGEFTEESQEIAFESDRVYDSLANDLKSIRHNKCMIFTASIHHCNKLTAAMKMRGFKCVSIHSQQHESINSYNQREFENDKNTICISVGTMTKGYDFPPIDLVVLMRATTSLPLYLQMVGRGSRLFPGKSSFTCLDYGGNIWRHGRWIDDRDWVALWQPGKKTIRDAVAPIKSCPVCEFVLQTMKMICPNCGHIFEKKRGTVEETQLIDVTNFVRGKKIGDLSPVELAQVAMNGVVKKSFAIRVAKSKGHENREFINSFAQAMGYKPSWVDHQDISEPIEFFNKTL